MASTAAQKFPWYETVSGDSLEQGDILPEFEIVLPVSSTSEARGGNLAVEIQQFDVVVMTQTCDIENDNVDSLLLCPWWDLWEFVRRAESGGQNWGSKIRDALRK